MPGFDLASPPHHPDRDTVSILDLAHYEAGIQASYAVNLAENAQDKLLVLLHTGHLHLNQEIIIP